MNSETGKTEIRVWTLNKDRLRLAEETHFASERLEKHLEKWLEASPDLLGRELLIIGRQVSTTSGPLDLLAIDALGVLQIIELKRDMLPRQAVAQALDYGAWLNSTAPEEIIRIAEDYLKSPLDEAFQDKFGDQMPDITPQNHKILVVGTGLDAGAERLIGYLSQRQSVQINAVLFKYVKVAGRELLIRSLLVPEALAGPSSRRRVRGPSELLEFAKRRGRETLIETLRSLSSASGAVSEEKEYVWEQASRAFDGAFRYWRRDLGGKKYKMVFGVTVSDLWGAKDSEVDIWIRPREVAQVTGLSDKRVKDAFAKFKIVQNKTRENRLVIRLDSDKNANSFVRTLKRMFADHPGSYRDEN
jgi:hypothetical protein